MHEHLQFPLSTEPIIVSEPDEEILYESVAEPGEQELLAEIDSLTSLLHDAERDLVKLEDYIHEAMPQLREAIEAFPSLESNYICAAIALAGAGQVIGLWDSIQAGLDQFGIAHNVG